MTDNPGKITLSIIVPVYNVETTLSRCVDSLMRQNLTDFEILLVDDGSTDGSALLADKTASNVPQIRVFHKPNGGLSDARNFGVSKALGEYVAFVDSDDEITPGLLSRVMTAVCTSGADILEFPVVQKNMRGETVSRFNPGRRSYDTATDWLVPFGLEHCWAVNKIYRRRIFDKVRFTKGIHYEDIVFMAGVMRLNPKISAVDDEGAYVYYQNDDSITARARENGLTELLDAQLRFVSLTGIDTREPRFHRVYIDMLTSQLYVYRKTGQLLLPEQRVKIRKYGSTAGLVKAVLLDTIGLKLTCKLFKLLRKR